MHWARLPAGRADFRCYQPAVRDKNVNGATTVAGGAQKVAPKARFEPSVSRDTTAVRAVMTDDATDDLGCIGCGWVGEDCSCGWEAYQAGAPCYAFSGYVFWNGAVVRLLGGSCRQQSPSSWAAAGRTPADKPPQHAAAPSRAF